jgi:hypothetical protein
MTLPVGGIHQKIKNWTAGFVGRIKIGDRTMPACNIYIPRVWKRLIREEFDGQYVKGTSRHIGEGKNQRGSDDPEAYFDDFRVAGAIFDNQGAINLELWSSGIGEEGYFAIAEIYGPEGELIFASSHKEVIRSLDDELSITCDGVIYTARITWTGHDPHEN